MKFLKTVMLSLAALLTLGLPGCGAINEKDSAAEESKAVRLQEIEREMDSIWSELEEKKKDSQQSNEHGMAAVGYYLKDVLLLPDIREITRKYDVSPVYVLDLNDDEEALRALLQQLQEEEEDYEILWSSYPFDAGALEQREAFMQEFTELEEKDSKGILLYADDETEENLQTILDAGFTSVIKNDDQASDTVMESGLVCCRGFLVTDMTSSGLRKLSDAAASASSLVFIFDTTSEDMEAEGMDAYLEYVNKNYYKSEKLVKKTVKEMVDATVGNVQAREELSQAYLAFEKEKKERMKELQAEYAALNGGVE